MKGMKIKLSNIYVFFLGCIFSCSSVVGELSPKKYIEFIQTTGNSILTNNKSINGVLYKMKYIPIEYMILKSDFCKKEVFDEKKYFQEYSVNKNTLFFNLIISDESKSFKVKKLILDKSEYTAALEKSNVQLQENIKLIIGEQIIPCVLCHLEPPSSIKPDLRISFEFDISEKKLGKEDFLITMNDQLLDNGLIKFRFLNEELNRLPKLKLN